MSQKKKPEKKPSSRRRDTEERLVSAIGEVLAEQGFSGLGVNAVAAKAGVDKVLLYRYFDGLPGLLKRFGESGAFWPSVDEVLAPIESELATNKDPAWLATQIMRSYRKALQKRPLTLEILAWECSSRNELTIALEQVRQDFGVRLGQALAKRGVLIPPAVNLATTIVAAAFHYLAVRGRELSQFGAINLASESGWQQVDEVVEAMLSGAFASAKHTAPNR